MNSADNLITQIIDVDETPEKNIADNTNNSTDK
jgi:hypothetical protein